MNYNLSELTPKKIEDLIKFLEEILDIKIKDKSTISNVITEEQGVCCPKCDGKNIVKCGHTKTNVQRYKCKDCNKKFVNTNNTICYHSKLTFEKWQLLFECMSDKLSIRKTAAKLGVNKNTAFAMRHKVLKALSKFRENVKLTGIIQADEVTIPINFKGLNQEEMPRLSKKRKYASKKVNHKVCILGAIDEEDNQYLEIVDYGEITSNDIEKSLGIKLYNATALVTDCKSSYESFAKDHNLKLEQVKSKTYKNSNGYTLSEINGLHSNFFLFMSSFRGVGLKHLQGYIDWFVFQKYISYASEFINHPKDFMYYCLKQKNSITIKEIYNTPFPFDVIEAYDDYISSPLI